MAEFKQILTLQTESGQSVNIDLRNALILAAAPTTSTAARAGMQAYVVSGGTITAEYVCTAVSGSTYTWVEREVSGGGGSAEVTAESIKNALGYTPADEDEVSELSEKISEQKVYKIVPPGATTVNPEDVTATKEGYLDKDGKFVSTMSFVCAEFVEINDDDTMYAQYVYDYAAGYAIIFYDAEKNIISGVGTGNTEVRIDGNIEIPAGSKYVSVTLLATDTNAYVQITSKLKIDISVKLKKAETDINDIKTEEINLDYASLISGVEKAYIDLNGVVQSSNSWSLSDYISVNEGAVIEAKLTTYATASAIAYFNENHNFMGNVVGETWSWETTLYPLNGTYSVPVGAKYMRVSAFVPDGYAQEQYVKITRSKFARLENDDYSLRGNLNVLILGDSYSRGSWVSSMRDVLSIRNIVNLSVVSATVRDVYADRTQHPYSDRPGTGNSGNKNTLACQIQKLKRLMTGTDLDDGELKIYENVADYPDIIVIEGGMNDTPDSDDKVATYQNQFLVAKTAYYKQFADSTAKEQTVYVKPTLEEIDRTCFAGAYRYICEELVTLFPYAQIFLTTASHMGYFTDNPNVRYGKIAEQQRMCADILSYSVIDWHAEGNINTIMVGLNGSGTADDPYTTVGGDAYTSDKLHPNAEGGRRYGRLAGKVIAQKYLGLA